MLLYNNQQVLTHPAEAKDRFFLLGEFTRNADGAYQITIAPDGPIVAQHDADVPQIPQESGIYFGWGLCCSTVIPRQVWDSPERRALFCLPQLNIYSHRMIGAGGIVSVQTEGQEPLTVLFEKTAGPSKGKMAQASGLSDESPLKTLWTKIVEETGVVIVDRVHQTLALVMIEPSLEREPAFESRAAQKEFFDALAETKKTQIETVRSQLPEDIRSWPITIERHKVSLSPEDDRYLQFVSIVLPGQSDPQQMRCLVSDSTKTANVNLLLPVRLTLPKGTEVICVDPEEFRRPVQMFTRAQMLTQGFINDRASVPMKPYLQEAMHREVSPAPTSAQALPVPGPKLG